MPALDRSFAIIDDKGRARFPYKKQQRSTGRYGFAISAPGERDARGGAIYTDDISEVVRKVVMDNWKVRACAEDGSLQGSVGLGGMARRYWVAPNLRSVVAGAQVRPEDNLPHV